MNKQDTNTHSPTHIGTQTNKDITTNQQTNTETKKCKNSTKTVSNSHAHVKTDKHTHKSELLNL